MDKLLNKSVDINSIVTTIPRHFGDLLINTDHFVIKFLWTTKQIPFSQVDKVKAYSNADFRLENHFNFLEIHTKDKNIISFNPNRPSHRGIVSNFIMQQFKKTIDLEVEDFPPDGADQNGEILCGSN